MEARGAHSRVMTFGRGNASSRSICTGTGIGTGTGRRSTGAGGVCAPAAGAAAAAGAAGTAVEEAVDAAAAAAAGAAAGVAAAGAAGTSAESRLRAVSSSWSSSPGRHCSASPAVSLHAATVAVAGSPFTTPTRKVSPGCSRSTSRTYAWKDEMRCVGVEMLDLRSRM
jgi:hypothetical protein